MSVIEYLFYAVLVLAVLKLSVQLALSFAYNLHRRKTTQLNRTPLISVVVPAYNEEKTIRACIGSLQKLNYPNYEIIVVDDGSTDHTYDEALKCTGVKIIQQPNKGKPNALNNGIRNSSGEIVITVDADTELDRNALQSIASRFHANEKVGAVAGNVKVKAEPGFLNVVQSAEYVTGINLVRKGQSVLGCVMIVPGPIAALKREAIEKAGFFTDDTFAEDFDITLNILKRGYRIEYDESSVAYTDSPKNIEDLVKQRRRWYRGMIQVLDKHKDMYFNHKLGAAGIFGVPSLWMETIAPFLNLGLLLITLLTWLLSGTPVGFLGIAVYLTIYFGINIIGLSLEPHLEKRNFLAIPILLFYSTFLDGVRIMSLTEETVNIVMEWEKPKR